MNWLAKINLKQIINQLGPFRSALYLLAIISLCIYLGYRIGNFYHGYQQNQLYQQQQRLNKLYQTQNALEQQIHMLEVELNIEKMANEKTLAQLNELESEHFEVKKQLAFYEKVMAPEKRADGMVIDSISILPTESFNHYRFQVVLVQQNKVKKYAKGFIQLAFSGSQNNKPVRVELEQISNLTRKDLSFNFRYFQIVEGEFTLPNEFIPEKIELAAILPKGKWQKYNRLDASYAWRDLAVVEQQVAQDSKP